MSNPSLILPQSPAYGEDYVYAAQVEDGAVPLYNVLPLTFTRASGGTRINKDGLVQNMPYNLLEQSNAFTTSPWSFVGTPTLTANYATNPLSGANDAWRFQSASGGERVVNAIAGAFSTFSVYAKGTGTMQIRDSSGTYYIDVALTSSWQRISVYIPATFTNVQILSNGGCDAIIYGAQLNIGSTAQPYLATTDRLNMPRITYPVGGGCGALLLEKQSTNLVTYSEQFDNGAWSKPGTTITANATTSPDGTQNADKVIADISSGSHSLFQLLSGSISSGTTYTYSFFAKSAEYTKAAIRIGGAGYATQPMAAINLSTGAIISQQGFTSVSVVSYANGWYRIAGTYVATSSVAPNIIPLSDSFTTTSDNYTYLGNGTSGIFAFGAMHEASSYATSYIPTTSTSATRIADACYKTGISNLIGQTEGTMFVHTYVGNETDEVYGWLQASLSGNPNDSIQINRSSSSIQAQIYNGSTPTALITGGTISKGQRIKVAFAYKVNDCVLYLNGTQIGVDTSTAIPACTLFQLGAYPPLLNDYTNDGGINNFQLFTTRLTNAELATLTTI